jgi:hypothetical protein
MIPCSKKGYYTAELNHNTPVCMTLFLHFHSILSTGGCVHKHLHTPLTKTTSETCYVVIATHRPTGATQVGDGWKPKWFNCSSYILDPL